MDMLMEEKFAKCLLISTLKTSKSSEYHFILTFSTLTPRLSQELNANLKAFCKISNKTSFCYSDKNKKEKPRKKGTRNKT